MANVLEKECTFECALNETVTHLCVKLGWDPKKQDLKGRIQGQIETAMMGASEKNYDLNLAAILEYSDGTKPELVFHNKTNSTGSDEANSILLSADDRTGFHKGSDETITIKLDDVPSNVKRIVLFMNIGSANMLGQTLGEVEGVFVQIENADDCAVLLREEEAFKNEDAKKYCAYTFAEICHEEAGWVLRGVARYSDEDREQETLKALIEK